MNKVIGFIGSGNMGNAMIGGIVSSELVPSDNIIVADLNEKQLAKVKETYGVNTTTDNQDVSKKANIIVLSIKPHIYHVVGFCEAHHAARADDIIESAMIVRGILKNEFLGSIDMTKDKNVLDRKSKLMEEANIIIDSIKSLSSNLEDPLTDPATLAEAVRIGILDAPQLKGNPIAPGGLKTRMVSGGLDAYDDQEGKIIGEKERINMLLKEAGYLKI